MKLQEIKNSGRGDIGFIDPYVINDKMLEDPLYTLETERNLLMFLTEQHYCNEILFPYRFKWVLLSSAYFYYYPYSMLSVIHVRRFHWILLNIHVESGVVDIMDSMDKPTEEYKNMTTTLHR